MAGRPDKPERIYLDSCIWIDWFSSPKSAASPVGRVMEWASTGQTMLLVSPLHMVEVLGNPPGAVPPDMRIPTEVFRLLTTPPAVLVEFDLDVGEKARDLRLAGHVKKPPDAIHLAHAIVGRADLFFTNDKGFPLGTTVEGVYVSQPYVLGGDDLFTKSDDDEDG